MLWVEEAGRSSLRQGLASRPGPHTGDGIPAVLENFADVGHVVRSGDGGRGLLRGLIVVERPLVVLAGALVQRLAGKLDIELLELLSELGDVLVHQALDPSQLGCGDLAALLLELASVRRADDNDRDEQDQRNQQQRHSGPSPCRRAASLRRDGNSRRADPYNVNNSAAGAMGVYPTEGNSTHDYTA